MAILELTKDSFDNTIEENDIVVIDFWANWCGPCRQFGEIFKNISQKYPNVVFAKVDIEKEKDLADEFNIRSIPFLMIFCKKVVVYAESGSLTEMAFDELITQALKIDPESL